ncbi:MAG TPA: hypothetical protein ENK02_00865 [Planctomycetes bacterium]|nr:hypothetical protein [Planctomycetota bacterium]
MGFFKTRFSLLLIAWGSMAILAGLLPGQAPSTPREESAPKAPKGAQETGKAAPYVRLKLKNGNILEGRVLGEAKGRILLRIGPGQTVDLPIERVAERRGMLPDKGSKDRPSAQAVPGRDEWFLLHDAVGRSVGSLHVLLRSQAGRLHIEELWTLYQGKEKVLIHRIEECDANFHPISFQFREVVTQRNGQGFPRERLVRGSIQDETLLLEEADARGRSKRKLVFSAGTQLPLSLKERLRQGGEGSFEGLVFDTSDVVFELRSYECAKGLPLSPRFFGSKSRPHNAPCRRIRWKESGARHSEWVSREGRTLLIEASGVELVGEPIPAALGKAMRGLSGRKALPRVFQVKGAELYAPDASWAFQQRGPAGTFARILSPDGSTSAWSRWTRSPRPDLALQGLAELGLRNFLLSHPGWTQGEQRLFREGRSRILETQVRDPKGRQAFLYFVPWEDGAFELGIQGKGGKALQTRARAWLDSLGSLRPALAKPGR